MIKIWHNPRCSKSRSAKEILEETNTNYELVEYLKKELTKEDIINLKSMLGIDNIREMLRSKENEYKENNLNDSNLTQDQIIEVILQNPKLIERPILVKGDKAIIARPPELALEFIK